MSKGDLNGSMGKEKVQYPDFEELFVVKDANVAGGTDQKEAKIFRTRSSPNQLVQSFKYLSEEQTEEL